MNKGNWQEEVREWIKHNGDNSEELAEDAVTFFKLAFYHTQCPYKAWFGVHTQMVSLVVGGIFLAALMCSGKAKGIWLLLDKERSIVDGIDYRPVKSTKKSNEPLIWAHSSSFAPLRDLCDEPKIWNSFLQASSKVLSSSTSSADRDTFQKIRKKRRLSEIWPIFSNPEICRYPDEVTDSKPLPEGTAKKVIINAYERNPEARKRCIDYYGVSCAVCGFNFGRVYGDIVDGYIHVHHLRPISDVGKEYIIDPIKDLRPVCPNCHAVIHLNDPPYTIEQAKELLKVNAFNDANNG
jgi:hypothetical protein